MTDKEKIHDIHVAYNLINNVLDDTDEELWAYEYLMQAASALWNYFEESEV